MIYLLDTDTCIYWLKGVQSVREHLEAVGIDMIAISTITVGELYFGAYNSAKVAENLTRAETFVKQIAVLPLSGAALKTFGQIKADLRKQGQVVADFDLLIASTALAVDTGDEQHPPLREDSWFTARKLGN